MIRVYKHPDAPASLAQKSSWNAEDVVAQLQSDQDGKCYLCERLRITDFQVEHLRSRANFQEQTFDWSNLFLCCGYCNAKKSSSFDELLNPAEYNVEDLICQSLDFPNARAVFQPTDTVTRSIEATTNLLNRIFNGTNRMRTIKEQQFYDYAVSRVTSFQALALSWLNNADEKTRNAIIEELDVRSEFLGFKYWIIKSDETLLSTFGKYLIWHKSYECCS